jgi:hypothetical protein
MMKDASLQVSAAIRSPNIIIISSGGSCTYCSYVPHREAPPVLQLHLIATALLVSRLPTTVH